MIFDPLIVLIRMFKYFQLFSLLFIEDEGP